MPPHQWEHSVSLLRVKCKEMSQTQRSLRMRRTRRVRKARRLEHSVIRACLLIATGANMHSHIYLSEAGATILCEGVDAIDSTGNFVAPTMA